LRVATDSLVSSNQKGDKYDIETKRKRKYRATSDRNLERRRESGERRRELGA
jgi:hypothetical protein